MYNLLGLGLSMVLIIVLLIYILKQKPKKQMHYVFVFFLILLFVHCTALILQIALSERYNIPPIYFEYLTYISGCFLPLAVLFCGFVFANTKLTFNKKYLLLFIIPITSLLVLWTNDLHGLFYQTYSTNMNDIVYGPYFNIHSIYSYTCLFVGILYLIFYSIKNSGFFSKQSILIIVGSLIPLIMNILGTFYIIKLSVYVTPITFTFAILFFALAMFKFDFLKVAPIALQRIVDRMSDGYMVLDEDLKIIDYNKTLIAMLNSNTSYLRNRNITELPSLFSSIDNLDITQILNAINITKNNSETVILEKDFKEINKYFNVEINSIFSKNAFIGTLLLFKNVTQHKLDLQTIEEKQSIIMEKERLSSLGQLIGGIAHNLKTPIMSVAGAIEGIRDLVQEIDSSLGNPLVTESDYHEITKEITEWINKIRTHMSYMSDVINAVKGQAVAMSTEENIHFTIEELVKRVDILMKHELKNALIDLNINWLASKTVGLKGDINCLVQVINNLISNAIQAYNGKPNEKIDFVIYEKDKILTLAITDYGPGIPKEAKDKLFKEMFTTKGKNGTGLGLYMSYSMIKGKFGGDMSFESEKGKGTTFFVKLPIV